MIQRARASARLALITAALAAATLLFDLLMPLGVAGGLPYVAIVLIGLWAPGRGYVLGLAALGTALTVLGYVYSPPGGVAWMVLTNRVLTIFAIWITALLVARHKTAEIAWRRSRAPVPGIVESSPAAMSLEGTDGSHFSSDGWFETMASLIRARDQAEAANRAKSEFLAHMSHELRTPLNAVIGFTEMMENEMLGPIGHPRYREYLRTIRGAGRHLLALITDILEVSKIGAGKLELDNTEVPVARVIGDSLDWVEEAAANSGCRLSTVIMNRPPNLYADERRLRQMLVNLLTNAIKFTPAGGEIILRAKVASDGGFVFSVADTGIGIAPGNIPTVLEAFGQVESAFDRQNEGAGLGLPLTKALVEQHGGTMEIESELGVGTTVRLRLPAQRVMHAHEPGSAGADPTGTDGSARPRPRGVTRAAG